MHDLGDLADGRLDEGLHGLGLGRLLGGPELVVDRCGDLRGIGARRQAHEELGGDSLLLASALELLHAHERDVVYARALAFDDALDLHVDHGETHAVADLEVAASGQTLAHQGAVRAGLPAGEVAIEHLHVVDRLDALRVHAVDRDQVQVALAGVDVEQRREHLLHARDVADLLLVAHGQERGQRAEATGLEHHEDRLARGLAEALHALVEQQHEGEQPQGQGRAQHGERGAQARPEHRAADIAKQAQEVAHDVASASGALRSSEVIRPLSRCTTRDATAAARGSCVTISSVQPKR